jgi:hypothetical protein
MIWGALTEKVVEAPDLRGVEERGELRPVAEGDLLTS